jgi:hypothetical protein
MKTRLRQQPQNAEGSSMSRSNLVFLDQHRRAQRARRALRFFVNLLGGGALEEVTAMDPPLPDVKHMRRLNMDIAVTRDASPRHSRDILAFARRREMGFILVRFRDPAENIAEALIEAFLIEGRGVAVLEQLSPVTPDGRHWWLAGPHNGDVNLRVARGDLVPTLSVPWPREEDRHSFTSRGDRLFSEYLWAK